MPEAKAEWKTLCVLSAAPSVGEVMEAEVDGVSLCVANHEGHFSALDNWCPHRQGPLGQGWMEGKTVVCPWHAWAFDLESGIVEPPDQGRVKVFPIRVEGEILKVCLDGKGLS